MSWDKRLIWCLNLKSALSIYSILQMSFWPCKNCSKIQEFENRYDLYTSPLGSFNYPIKGKRKCLYQFLIRLTLPISIWQIFEVLKQCQCFKLDLISCLCSSHSYLNGHSSCISKFEMKVWNENNTNVNLFYSK